MLGGKEYKVRKKNYRKNNRENLFGAWMLLCSVGIPGFLFIVWFFIKLFLDTLNTIAPSYIIASLIMLVIVAALSICGWSMSPRIRGIITSLLESVIDLFR